MDPTGRRHLREGEKPGPIAPPGWPLAVMVPAVVGALWLWLAAQSGGLGVLLGLLPGTLLLATGLSNLL